MSDARSVLFVCHGNICRSPFAELYARKLLAAGADPPLRVRSTGYFPRSGRSSPAEAVAAAQEFGVTLAGHRSSVITQSMVDEADLIFVFDQDNVWQLTRRFPAARSRVFFAGILGCGPIEIADPYGTTAEQFRECYRNIARQIDALAELSQGAVRSRLGDRACTRGVS
jgi:protein-tyrosine phosphatase